MSELKVNKISPSSGTAFTLGDSGDTFTVPSGATIVNSGTATGFGGGKINQVVIGTLKTSLQSTTVDSWHDMTGVTATITPSATDSKILVFINVNINSDDNQIFMRMVSATDTILTNGIGDADGSRERVTGGSYYFDHTTGAQRDAKIILDEPATTSAVVYTAQWYGCCAGMVLFCNQNNTVSDTDNDASFRSISTVTLMEVLA